jgi:hypothetical protein
MAPLAPTFTIANPSPALFPNALAVIASGSASGFGDATAIPYETAKSPRAIHYNLNLQQQVGQAAVFTLGYIGSRGINQYSSGGNFNMPLATFNGTSLEFPVGRTVLNPAFGLINYSTGNVDSWYNGLTATMQHRAGAGLQMMVTYTFSKTLSDGSDRSANSSDSSSVKYPYDMRATKGLSAYDLRHVLSVNYSYDLPFKGGNWRSGWQLTGIISARSGQPFNISAAVPSTLSPLGVGIRSPNLVPGFTKDQIIQGGADQYFNPMAYSLPGSRELGNVGRDTLTGPGLVQWDMGLTKNIAPSERWHVQFRAELFNILNHANFSPPGELQGAGSSANSGQIFAGNGSRLGTAGLIDHTVTTSRQIQLGVKLIF